MARRSLSLADDNTRLTIVLASGILVISIAVAVISSMREHSRQIAESAAEVRLAEIVGPACPAVRAGAFSEPLKADQSLEFNGAVFARRFGNVNCGVASSKDPLGQAFYSVCQFSSPAVLSVRTVKGVFYYEPGLSKKATVIVQNGVPRCILASPYWSAYMRAVTDTDANGKATPFPH